MQDAEAESFRVVVVDSLGGAAGIVIGDAVLIADTGDRAVNEVLARVLWRESASEHVT